MQIRIHSEGRIYFISTIILAIICVPFFPILAVILFVVSLYIFYFFRDPIRTVPTENLVISPADGTITYIGQSNPPKETNISDKFLSWGWGSSNPKIKPFANIKLLNNRFDLTYIFLLVLVLDASCIVLKETVINVLKSLNNKLL